MRDEGWGIKEREMTAEIHPSSLIPHANWSGRGDLNARPPAPKAGALPGCATPRLSTSLILKHFLPSCNSLCSRRSRLCSRPLDHGKTVNTTRFGGGALDRAARIQLAAGQPVRID